jgi:hypothetical protein
MTRPSRNKPPFQQLQTRKLPKKLREQLAPPVPVEVEEPSKKKKKVRPAPETITFTEKIVVRTRPERAYFAIVDMSKRSLWDKHAVRSRFIAAAKGIPVPTKPFEGAMFEFMMPMRMGGVFQFRYAMLRQPQGFALEAVRGGLGVLGGMAESFAFATFKGATEITLTRTIVPRFKPLTAYVKRNHEKALKETLEGLRKYIEENTK